MVKIPEWRQDPEPVLVNCLKVHEWPQFGEYIVQFENHEGHFTSFVPKQHVIPDGKFLHAFIIADVENGVLVDIPAETLTSGPRIQVTNAEKDTVLTFRNWVKELENGT